MAGGSGWGTTADKLYYPWGVYVDSNQAVYVVDRSNHRVQKWTVGKCFPIEISFINIAYSKTDVIYTFIMTSPFS